MKRFSITGAHWGIHGVNIQSAYKVENADLGLLSVESIFSKSRMYIDRGMYYQVIKVT